ncbi:hypothetical protein HanXRQr2_Chr03g0102161 [Helianthus annuus]|uniref:Uncharacterized protein n=1 Tax=Helianthus annuus TaxID=4232 RepID=A0A9K3JFK9_HELAN|nr:hypothetical protein HanXRQr2_Chr03g0102161 [Helianthus annuus]KAJ0942982.1 hypothetical protein HanPSC8_Chr03g0098601 [Helianthus annuus]
MFNLRSSSGTFVTIQIGIVLQFDANSPCDRTNLILTHQTIQNLFLSYVKVI